MSDVEVHLIMMQLEYELAERKRLLEAISQEAEKVAELEAELAEGEDSPRASTPTMGGTSSSISSSPVRAASPARRGSSPAMMLRRSGLRTSEDVMVDLERSMGR
jgi:hypothetical protein